ncbi:ADP-glucose phosphorylase [Citrus sinensis]|uniref:ADP-glucose phosphorylase isoform X1 n=1 Tax=Citrus sinensis TaxID=2711 RepID=UPI00219E059F|nr:ADP-glucose phosphorylase isoform X1 [Citrus sinensis]KAH9728436.1 ADP-glucose phosphorylase [Citrus sinensis]
MASPSSTQTQSRSPEIRKDPVNNRWVIFSPARAKRPTDFKAKSPQNPNSSSSCPFCIGNEHECAPEIFRVPPDPKSDWKIRVIQNLYPALSRDIGCKKDGDPDAEMRCTGDLGRVVTGFGFHDVVIESPVHSVQLQDLEPREVGEVLLACKKRIEQIKEYDLIKYVQVFKNHGASAGASMSHSHSQLLALPVIPPTISARINSTKEYFDQSGKCCLCEVQPKDLQIDVTTHFISIVPFAATFPFEIWIIPRNHSSHFHELDNEKAVDLGGLLKLTLRKISVQLNNPPFNFMIQTAPLQAIDTQLAYIHWFLQIVPQLAGVGGFEIGTGCYINPVFSEDAAKVMQEVNVPK